jgi:hypothetical protein
MSSGKWSSRVAAGAGNFISNADENTHERLRRKKYTNFSERQKNKSIAIETSLWVAGLLLILPPRLFSLEL